ncbi:MAG: TAXI family TRAP transporter solute-binding subunit [Vicinamibacterales bacterium]|nr:TAXI family TRAP transporter solute-binding subunit [Vicinamibacterales bacterium]
MTRTLITRRLTTIAGALALVVAAGCGAPAERTFLTIATAGTGGVYYPLGGALAQIYSAALPGVNASAQSTVGSVFNVQAVQQGRADVAFTMGDIAWFAYEQGTDSDPTPHRKLRTLAVLYQNTVQIVARRDGPLHTIADLRGQRVGVGAPGSGTEVSARVVIEAHGLSYADVRPDYLSFAEVAAQMQDRTLDAGVVTASFPVSAITDASMTVGVRLLPVSDEALARIRAQYPFFTRVTIPAGTYRGQDEDVPTVAVENLLVVSEDLDEQLAYDLTRLLFESLEELGRTHVAAKEIDVADAATAPIPLHPGAERYYRERGVLPAVP